MAKAKIMIVEDEAIIAKDIENILLNYGYNITGIYSKGEDALLSLQTQKPDLILMDVVLKGEIDGIEAANIIKQTLSIPIIFITAYADEITISRIKKYNAYGYFLKPFEEKEIQTWIETTLVKFNIEEELKRNERTAISILNYLDEAFIITDETGKIKLMNENAEKLMEINFKEAEKKKLNEVIKNVDITAKTESLLSSKLPQVITREKATVTNYSNKSINIEYQIIPISDNGINQGLTILFKKDNRDYKEELNLLAAKLNESNKELEKFAYIASHDLQEPLRMVASYVQLLKKRYKGKLDVQADEFIDFAVDGVNRMRKLIDDLLLYSRISSKKLIPEEIDCNEVINGIIPEINKNYNLSGRAIKFSNLPVIKADRYQIHNLFYHLLENSVKFNEQIEPQVEISALNQNKNIIFLVSDNGIGIEKQYSEKIFEAFQKLHHHKEYQGSGIGLTLCKKIIELHGGNISVDSMPGKGTTVRFVLPVNFFDNG